MKTKIPSGLLLALLGAALVPALAVAGGTVKLTPHVRSLEHDLPTLVQDAYAQFLGHPLVFNAGWLDGQPSVVSGDEGRIVAITMQNIYAQGLRGEKGQKFTVVHPLETIQDPDNHDTLGETGLYVADVELVDTGNSDSTSRPGAVPVVQFQPATLKVLRASREIMAGDRVVPRDQFAVGNLKLRSPSQAIRGRILSAVNNVLQIGKFETVVINLGERDGLQPGHVLSIFQSEYMAPIYKPEDWGGVHNSTMTMPGASVGSSPDVGAYTVGGPRATSQLLPLQTKVRLPMEAAGQIVVVHTYERLSYGFVISLKRSIHLMDTVATP